MISRREFERERLSFFVTNLFCELESWVNSLKAETHSTDLIQDREKLERMLQHGSVMSISKLAAIVGGAYRRWYVYSESGEQVKWEEIHLNNAIRQLGSYSKQLFETMGSSLMIPDSPEVIIQIEQDISGPLFTYVLWWILDAWPDSHIVLDFVVDKEKVKIVFHDLRHTCTKMEYRENHKILLVWACIIEYLVMVEHHGWCRWPQSGEKRRLEIFLPLHPPTAEELDASLPVWMQ